MTEKIGKLSLIFGMILSVLLAIAGWASQATELFSNFFDSDSGYYPFFTLMLFFAMLVSNLAAWLICFLKRKKSDEPQQEMPNSIGVLFKTYFYLWTIASIAIILCSFLFLGFRIYSVSNIFGLNAFLVGFVWLCTVIVCIMVWAAVNAWKASEIMGVILAVIAFIVFASSGVVIGAFYHENAYSFRTYDRDYAYEAHEAAIREAQREAQRQAEQAEIQHYESNEEYVEYVDESESDIDRALRYMKFKFELETEQNANDLIRRWSYYWTSYKEHDFGFWNSDHFNGPIHFFKSKADFYFITGGNMKDNAMLTNNVNNHSERIDPRGGFLNRNAFVRSGASDCLQILLWAYDDIYSKEDSEGTLRDMYNYMTRDTESEYYYGVVEAHYEGLRTFMSDDVVSNIRRICRRNTHDVDWATASLATWAYSFWARRHHDNIDGTVHRVLKVVERMYN